ncbi:MAG: hypothetical protein EZS28_033078 [Streblomastix strix]|uniref:Uncharacterized protein n=1 Tax=Streblomastix strix TaxID=222440 RepID=A0A5J4UL50_9EUKA|nr:MAG: hypothetical protein EZS28_033078 [Streblomastix strix]
MDWPQLSTHRLQLNIWGMKLHGEVNEVDLLLNFKLSQIKDERAVSNNFNKPEPLQDGSSKISNCKVLFPGAAHASITIDPGGGFKTRGGMHDARSCIMIPEL